MKTLKTLGAISLIAMTALGIAQDFPGLQGGSARQGVNTGALLNSAGRAFLTWYAPLINDVDGYKLIRDNNTTQKVFTPGWNFPAQIDEAPGAFLVQAETPTVRPDIVPIGTEPVRQRINWFENALRGIAYYGPGPVPAGYTAPGAPGYAYSRTVPSAADPLTLQFIADSLNTFSWTVEPPADPSIPNQRYSRNYALSAYINVGPTGDGVGNLLYQQRYWVYTIQHATGTYTDIVDTFASGNGFVRLGGGGLPTSRLFTYDGTNPIVITLYNTVPRKNGHQGDVIPAPFPINDPRWLNTYPSQPYSTIVCADAVQAIPVTGEYASTPIVSALDPAILGSPIRVFAARNTFLVGNQNGEDVTTVKAIATAYDHATGNKIWSYSPIDESDLATTLDNTSAGVTGGALPWFTTTAEPGYLGANYFKAPAVVVAGTEQNVRYTPTLTKGTYEILAWLPGSRGLELLARQVVYLVHEGATTTTVLVDQDVARGWVNIGARRFTHDPAGAPLSVDVTNLSNNPADIGREVMTDSVKFIGAANMAATSTMVHKVAGVRVTNGGPVVQTPVVLLATEDGKLSCLDATGNGDGTTNIYWTYPSTPDPNNPGWTDPNAVLTEDGPGPSAQMPIGFDLGSALVETIGGVDYLFVASKNGRIYCIEMAGRGDMTIATRLPGTTRRVWTYPNDFPAPSSRTGLGAFTGSLAYSVTAAGPTIFAGAPQGRVYAIEALPAVITNKTTNVRWTYPALNQPTLGAIRMTPAVEGNRVFFGTERKVGDDRGRFYSLDADTGAVNWEFNSTALWVNTAVEADHFLASPVFVAAPFVATPPADPAMIVVANENRYITSLDAATGAVLWVTDELGSSVIGGLSVAQINAFDGGAGGTRTPATLILVPTSDGTFAGIFAKSGAGPLAVNRFGTKLAWRYLAAGDPVTASISSGRTFIYGADAAGNIYAFNNLGNGANGDVEGPGVPDTVPGDASDANTEDFREGKLLFVTRDTYQRLRLPDTDINHLTYAQVIGDPTRHVTQTAFDWGQTVYALAYDFPYLDVYTQGALAGTGAPPPIVNYRISVEGASIRNLSIEARRFRLPLTAPMAPSGARRLDGYACYPYIIQSGGSNAMPPGNAQISFGVATSALTDPPRQVNITLNPAQVTKSFVIANPIALIMGVGAMFTLGFDYDPGFAENLVNGSPDLPGPKLENKMSAILGFVNHGQANAVQIGIVDRSLMTLLRGPEQGLDNVRVQVSDLAWQGGYAAVHKPIDSIPYYAAFYGTGKGLEDYPINFPNLSFDYPDLDRQNIKVTKDPNGFAENPLFNTINLFPVTNVNELVSPPTRTMNPTPFDFGVNVPRFQPTNTTGLHLNSDGSFISSSGFYGGINVFVDSNGDGVLTQTRGRREAFRLFNMAIGVPHDERITMETATLDLGNLASGTGYDPGDPKTGTTFSPWGGPYQSLFRPLTFHNEGNVNLLNIRLAKTYSGGNPWEIFSATNHELAWLDGNRNLHATFDSDFQNLIGQPILPKARVGDSNPTAFRDNPRVRDNSNIGATAGVLDVRRPDPESPRVAVSLPLGFPVGLYSSIIRVIEDNDQNEDMGAAETFSDPTTTLKFTPRETRATNSYTPNTATMVDDLIPNTAQNFLHANAQPTGMRTADGHLVTAFTSDRFGGVGANFDIAQPLGSVTDPQWRIYIGSVQGAAPAALPGTNPIRDLNAFVPASPTRWFQRDVPEYPTTPPAVLFPGDPVVGNTAKYGSPAFPGAGMLNPITGAVHPFAYMAFIGSAQKQGAQERYGDTRIFLTQVTVSPTGGTNAGVPVGLPNDPQMAKSAPSVYQLGNDATVFFTAHGTGQPQIHYASYDGAAWNATRVLSLGSGFEGVGGANVSGRVYQGVGGGGQPANGSSILEIAFTGKLRGRPANEIFITRMAANGVLPGNQFFYPTRTNEVLRTDTEPGTYRASGVSWDLNNVNLNYSINGAAPVTLEVPGTRETDRASGLITFGTVMGGKAYLDPNLGTVRLTNSLPVRNLVLYLTYRARVLKLSASGTGYSGATMMFDNRLIGELSYWADPTTNTAILPGDPVRSSRYVVTYSRAAAGNGQTARPYMQTLRFGVQLPYDIATAANGNVVAITVAGASSFYQVDPSNGRVYFTASDENRNITVTYTGLDDAGNPINVAATNYTVSLMTERGEIPVLMDQTVNESQMSAFLDPFDISGGGNARRPGLIWMLWTSTRTGTPDIFFQTIAPRFTPVGRQ